FRKDTWSSEGYLREAYGPLAPTFRWVAGDAVIDQMTLKPLPDDFALGRTPLLPYFPPALAAEWDAYFERFVSHYGLDEQKRTEARGKPDKKKKPPARCPNKGSKVVRRTPPHGPAFEVERPTPQRLQEYQDKLREARDLQARGLAEARQSGLAEQVQKVF